MWPPVSERLTNSTTAEVPLNYIRPELLDIVQAYCRTRDRLSVRRSLRRIPRTEPLYRRASDARHQPYATSAAQRHTVPADVLPPDQEHGYTLQLGITNDDIQAAGILMLFSKSHQIQGRELSVCQENAVSTQSVMLPNNNLVIQDCTAPTNWLQTLRRQPRQNLLRILRNLCIPPFDLPRDRRRWRGELYVQLMSCMMLQRIAPVMPTPAPTPTPTPTPISLQKASVIAGQLVEHATHKKMPKEQDVCCADCGLLPVLPVTGQCGHTRCLQCIKKNEMCACGVPAPQEPYVDTCVQHLVDKILSNNPPSKLALRVPERPPVKGQPLHDFVCDILGSVLQENYPALARSRTVAQSLPRDLRVSLIISPGSFTAPDVPARLPMTPQVRVLHAYELIRRKRYLEAAVHLARAATYTDFEAAGTLLVKTIEILLEEHEPETLRSELSHAVSEQAAVTWLAPGDLECVLCRDTYVAPITTPCGHTYCRRCIKCTMDYKKACPLCTRDLTNFNLALTRQSAFVSAALASIDMLYSLPPPLPADPSIVPVFICITTFPKVSCPLMISAPRYRVLIRQILESGSRRLGIVTRHEEHSYGTMLEVRDCVECDDGRLILSTTGVSRFRIVELLMDSCLARVETLTDIIPEDRLMIRVMREVGLDVVLLSLIWLKSLKRSVLWSIEGAFGRMPLAVEEWWSKPDGPDWLWWLAACLPLSPETKELMVSSNNLMTRLRIVRRTLQMVSRTRPFRYDVVTCL